MNKRLLKSVSPARCRTGIEVGSRSVQECALIGIASGEAHVFVAVEKAALK